MRALLTDPKDNVAIVIQAVKPGDVLEIGPGCMLKAEEEIPMGHKIALTDIPAGTMVMKFGVPIGRATADIAMGTYAHIHNIEDITEELCRGYDAEYRRKAGAL